MSTVRRSVLVVVFQFPPYDGSSAVQRALRFVQHLPKFGWDPVVLTADPMAYEQVRAGLDVVPQGVHVERAFALDAKRHLAWRGRYPGFLAYPDRWRSWQWGARVAGKRLVRRFRPAAIWSTYPIVSAHEIALGLARWSRLPWIADFRDPMVEEDFPVDTRVRADFARRELEYSRIARCFTVTAPGLRDWFVRRYPHLGREGVQMIENGYDEASFGDAAWDGKPLRPGAITLLHSGELYPEIRDPVNLFAAARELRERGVVAEGELRFRFRGAGDQSIVTRAARKHGLEAAVDLLPRVGHREALAEMLAADGLVILQGADCNRQIPAKLYEYMRTRRPILGLTDPAGDTGRTMLAAGYDCVAALADAPGIVAVLDRFVRAMRTGASAAATADTVAAASREARAGALAALLDRIAGGTQSTPGLAAAGPARAS